MNALLAFGAIAFTVPLAIHLLFRSRFRTVDWGAMHLLDSVVRINRRRIQLLQLLLLLIRCLLPVLLAFCLARPILTGFHALPGDAPQSLVLAIDDSRSMSARDESGITRMDRVKQDLKTLLAKLSRQDEVILIRASDVESPPPTMGAQEAIRQVRDLRTEFGPVDLDRLVRAAIDAADQSTYPQRRIVVVSDFQSQMLQTGVMESLQRQSTSLADKSIRPVISFLNLGVDSQLLANVSVESIEVNSPAVVAGRGARFTARLRNASDTPAGDLRVVWSIDSQPLEPRTVTIPPRSTVTTRLSRRLDEVGVREITVSVEHGDALIADNRRSIAIDVIREIRVMLVDGKPSSRPLESETDYLAIALSPFAFGGDDQPDAVRTSVIRVNQLEQELDQQSPDVVVLANVDDVQGKAREKLAQFVLDGGGLMVFDGDRLNTPSYNEPWVGVDNEWSMPARLGEFVGEVASRDAVPLPLGDANSLYSPWDVLGSEDQQPFGKVDVYGYRTLTVNESQAAEGIENSDADGAQERDEAAVVPLLNMANGDPLVLWTRRGRGHVVQFAIPCDTAWTTLPMRLVYLPMMQQSVLDLAGSRKETTIEVGNAFAVPVSELTSLLPEEIRINERKKSDANQNAAKTNESKGSNASSPTYSLEFPGQAETAIQPSEESSPQLQVASTKVPGQYRLRRTTPIARSSDAPKSGAASSNATAEPIVTSTLRIVEVPAIESQLRDTEPTRLLAAADLLEAEIYTDIETLQHDDRTRRHGREIWRWLLVGLVVLMVAELFLQQRSLRAAPARTS